MSGNNNDYYPHYWGADRSWIISTLACGSQIFARCYQTSLSARVLLKVFAAEEKEILDLGWPVLSCPDCVSVTAAL